MRVRVRPVLHKETLVVHVLSNLLCGSHFTPSHDFFQLLLAHPLNLLFLLHRVPLIEWVRVRSSHVLPIFDLLLCALLVSQLVG